MFKIQMAGIFAILAALIIGLAGLIAGARYTTILLRSLAGFLLSGALLYIVFFLLDKYGMPAYLKKNPALQKEWVSEKDASEASDTALKEEQGPENEHADIQDGQENEEKPAEIGEFAPLATDELKHVSSPQDS